MEKYITDYKKGDNLDVETMINDFKNYVWSIIENHSRGFLKAEDKEEIISDVFLSVWHNKEKIEEDKQLNKYIAGITKNLVKNKLRQNNKNKIEISEDEMIDTNSIELIYEQNEINRVVKEELNNLNKYEYEIFCKYYYCSKSIKQIATELELSENNVKVKLHRIRKKLKVSLSKKGLGIKVISVILIFSFITGVTFAKQILDFISVKFFNVSEGVDTAVENGYIQEVNMKYQNGSNTETNNDTNNSNIGVKVDYLLMDDFYLNIVFNIDLQEINNLSGIEFDSLVITDEENNLLLTKFENRSKYLQFCKENKIEKTFNHMALGTYNSINLVYDYKNSNYTSSYTIRAFDDSFPKSKKLYISFDSIILYIGKRSR